MWVRGHIGDIGLVDTQWIQSQIGDIGFVDRQWIRSGYEVTWEA